jgi:hypothetical protein
MVSIAEVERIRAERLSESRTRVAETRKCCSKAAATAGQPKAAEEQIEQMPMIS